MSQPLGPREGAAALDFALIALVVLGAALSDVLNETGLLVVALAYFLARDGWNGQSLGKFITGVQVLTLKDRKPIGLGRSIVRNLAFPLGIGILVVLTELMRKGIGDKVAAAGVIGAGMGYIAYYFGAKTGDFRTLGDQMAGTVVVPLQAGSTAKKMKLLITATAWVLGLSLLAVLAYGVVLSSMNN